MSHLTLGAYARTYICLSEQDWLDDGARDGVITNLDPTLRHRASPAQTIYTGNL